MLVNPPPFLLLASSLSRPLGASLSHSRTTTCRLPASNVGARCPCDAADAVVGQTSPLPVIDRSEHTSTLHPQALCLTGSPTRHASGARLILSCPARAKFSRASPLRRLGAGTCTAAPLRTAGEPHRPAPRPLHRATCTALERRLSRSRSRSRSRAHARARARSRSHSRSLPRSHGTLSRARAVTPRSRPGY